MGRLKLTRAIQFKSARLYNRELLLIWMRSSLDPISKICRHLGWFKLKPNGSISFLIVCCQIFIIFLLLGCIYFQSIFLFLKLVSVAISA